eukprot:753028-Hanusia_phi.AAC.4
MALEQALRCLILQCRSPPVPLGPGPPGTGPAGPGSGRTHRQCCDTDNSKGGWGSRRWLSGDGRGGVLRVCLQPGQDAGRRHHLVQVS